MYIKRLLIVIILYLLTFSFSFSVDLQSIRWNATWDNLNLDFESDNTNAWLDLNSFTWNVCGLWYKWYPLSWYVDTDTVWYAYFNEDDGDDTVDSCVWLILSGSSWYMLWTGAMDSDTGDTIYFDNIKLIWSDTNKYYTFSGKAITSSLWEVTEFTWVYLSWLNLISWEKTKISYTDCKDGSVYANGNSCKIKMILNDIWWNPVQIMDSLTWTVQVLSWLENKVFISTWWDISKTISISWWILEIPLYFLKPVSWIDLSIKLNYPISDDEGNMKHLITLTGINILNPIKNIKFTNISNNIIWETTTGNYSLEYYDTGLLVNNSKISFSWNFMLTWNSTWKYAFSWNLANQNGKIFFFKIYPKDLNYNQSLVNVIMSGGSIIYHFDDFAGATWEYTINNIEKPSLKLYADKRVDWSESYISSTDFSGNTYLTAWTWVIPSFNFKLKNHNWYVIPDVKVNIELKDMWIANSYSGWDCDEKTDGYQVNCSGLLLDINWNLFSKVVDDKIWADIDYNVSWSDYKNINIISLKPVTWSTNIYFEIKDIQNIYSWWNFENSWDWIWMNNYTWNLLNLHFLPALKMDFKWLNDGSVDNVDINNEIAVYFNNLSSNAIFNNVNYELFWKIIIPKWWVRFSTWYWDILTWHFSSLLDSGYNLNKILLSFDYMYDSWVLLNYNSGYISYWINYSWINMWQLKLKPWYFFYDLNAWYKFLWVFVLWLINKVQKWSTSVKTVLWRSNGKSNAPIDTTFWTVYNRLKKKAYFMTQWLKNNLLDTSIISSLDWWVKYFKCDDNTKVVVIKWLTYSWKNTLLFENCNVLIKWNLYKKDNDSNLVIFTYSFTKKCDILNKNYLDSCNSNIYIAGWVSDIQAWLLALWSILTIKKDIISDSNILIPNRTKEINNKQLVVNWMLMWKDTIWWSILTKFWNNSYFTLPWSYKLYKNDSLWWYSNLSDKMKLLQIFDANFRRWIKLWTEPDNKWEHNWINWTHYSKDWFSQYCIDNNYPLKCKYPVLFIYDPFLKNNEIFK